MGLCGCRGSRIWAGVCLALLVVATTGVADDAESFVWVDEEGITHLTDNRSEVPPAARSAEASPDRLQTLWGGSFEGPPLATPRGSSGSASGRIDRLLDGVRSDLERGERARAAATLRSVLRLDPARAEPHARRAPAHSPLHSSPSPHLGRVATADCSCFPPRRLSGERPRTRSPRARRRSTTTSHPSGSRSGRAPCATARRTLSDSCCRYC